MLQRHYQRALKDAEVFRRRYTREDKMTFDGFVEKLNETLPFSTALSRGKVTPIVKCEPKVQSAWLRAMGEFWADSESKQEDDASPES